MAREIKSAKDTELIDSVERPSNYKERLVKLIPSEIIAAYVTIYGLVQAFNGGNKEKLLWIVIVILIIITPVYLIKVSKVTKKSQLLFSTIGFVIWVFATGSPAPKILEFPPESLASIVLIIQTLSIPLFYKG
ncbi:hypothetical protein FNW52_18970 [Flavobacterium sp. ZT3R18]|uniref:hypothetical protein n=1 Tax=Flavobacterium sp. ZT3R18 TaxID=2594429 RepID=UPI001179E072|nr:hypothetical protein [Flavobacterium sp. ZT3R18]TRX31198.1 hypothetical protein FNW52_18970 [Flavobacterium sp. ZT3R18]